MTLFDWRNESVAPLAVTGDKGGWITRTLNLSRLHSEREFLRQGHLLEINGEWCAVTRTMNNNAARAIRLADGETVWLSEDPAPPPATNQVSGMGFGDIDADGRPEVILVSYEGDVICINALDGTTKWHRRLPWHINNPRLDLKPVTASPGLNMLLAVGNDFTWARGLSRPRINLVHNPSLVVLNGAGETELLIEHYDVNNGNGHNMWMCDIDGDGFCELIASGHDRILVYDQDGSHLFDLPCRGDEGDRYAHPDGVIAADWCRDRAGCELVYLDGESALAIADASGTVVEHRRFPREVASHLQEVRVVPDVSPPNLLLQNIRARDAKLLCLDHDLELLWAARSFADISRMLPADIDGNDRSELVFGSHGKQVFNEGGSADCALHVMQTDGTPLYRHVWEEDTMCVPLDAADVDGDGIDEILVSIGTPGGPEGRFSLAEDSEQRLFLLDPQPVADSS